jgi:carbonic anhydrase
MNRTSPPVEKRDITALSPINTIKRYAVVIVVLGVGGPGIGPFGVSGADAADPHSSTSHNASKNDTHEAANKPMVLKPGQPKKMHRQAPKKGPKTSHAPALKHPPSKSKKAEKTAAKKTKKQMKAPHSKPMMRKAAKSSHSVPWGYQGAGGPAHWGGLKQAYKACSEGHSQSPVNIESAEAVTLAPLGIHYKVSLIEMINNGHTVQANYGKGSYITLGAERYDLLQFHFHTPSEHRIAGRSFPMEIHFVHRNKRGQLAVVGVLATFGDYNLAAREIWDRLPARAHTKSADTRALINARDLLPENTKYFRYSGSLTTPPCSEKVNWMVLQTPVHFSQAQIARLHRIIGMNARPAQARNSRYLLQSVGG